MQSRSRFIKHINSLSCTSPAKFRCKLYTLCLTTRQSSRRLSKFNIRKTHIIKGFHLITYTRNIFKKCQCLLNSHIKHIIYTLTLIFYIQGFPVIPFTTTYLTWYIDIWQEIHLYLNNTITTARLTSSTLNIKTEPALLIPLHLGIRSSSKYIPYQVKYTCIRCRI